MSARCNDLFQDDASLQTRSKHLIKLRPAAFDPAGDRIRQNNAMLCVANQHRPKPATANEVTQISESINRRFFLFIFNSPFPLFLRIRLLFNQPYLFAGLASILYRHRCFSCICSSFKSAVPSKTAHSFGNGLSITENYTHLYDGIKEH